MTCTVVEVLHTTVSTYCTLALGAALGWLCAALCYAARRSEDAQRRAAGLAQH